MMTLTEELAKSQGLVVACDMLDVVRSAVYRFRQRAVDGTAPRRFHVCAAAESDRHTHPRALSETERDEIVALLDSERFQDLPPREVYAQLLDEGKYICSWRTMYRILSAVALVRERRNQRRHPTYKKPELLATGPNQVWTWDITLLRGPGKGVYYYLYVIIDIFSRYIVGWMIAEVQTAKLAERLIAKTCAKHQVQPGQLTIHADNGGPMTAQSVKTLMKNLEVTKSHSRPHVSNDNPYSEAQFKTLKYRSDYPDRFSGLDAARQWARQFFAWYNEQHHHTGLGLLTPATVHAGLGEITRQQRQAVLRQAFEAHPERFVHGAPEPDALPTAFWINPPATDPGQPLPAADPSTAYAVDTQEVASHETTAIALAHLPGSEYAPACGTEDRATLESDLSGSTELAEVADPVEGVAGRGRQRMVVLPARSPQTGPHLRKSEKLNRTRPRARLEPAPGVADCSPPPATPRTRTLISAPDLSQNHCHIPLKPADEAKLQAVLAAFPTLRKAYLLKETFRTIADKIKDRKQAERFLRAWHHSACVRLSCV